MGETDNINNIDYIGDTGDDMNDINNINNMDNTKDISGISDLSEIYEIKAENIDVGMYFMSLTDNAMQTGLLTEAETEFMQTQIYDLLSDIVWRYTNGTSVSVTSQEANELLLSVLYALDCFCISQTGDNITDGDNNKLKILIDTLKQKSGIVNCYYKGQEFINKTLEEVKILAQESYLNRIHTTSALYNKTLNRSIFVFIEKYKYTSVHRIDADIDYFTAVGVKKRKGVLYIKKYLEYLNFETAFYNKCAEYFGEPEIKELIKIYSRNNLTEERELTENIFEIIFPNVFFLFLAKIKDKKLTVNQEEFEKLSEIIYNTPPPDLPKLINKAAASLFMTLKITGGLKNYVSEYIKIFAKKFIRSVKSIGLDNLFTVDNSDDFDKNEYDEYNDYNNYNNYNDNFNYNYSDSNNDNDNDNDNENEED